MTADPTIPASVVVLARTDGEQPRRELRLLQPLFRFPAIRAKLSGWRNIAGAGCAFCGAQGSAALLAEAHAIRIERAAFRAFHARRARRRIAKILVVPVRIAAATASVMPTPVAAASMMSAHHAPQKKLQKTHFVPASLNSFCRPRLTIRCNEVNHRRMTRGEICTWRLVRPDEPDNPRRDRSWLGLSFRDEVRDGVHK